MKKVLTAIFLLIFIACGHSDRVENAYRRADEWEKDRANISWKPAFLPGEAEQIKEIHNTRTQEMIGVYHYQENPLEEGVELKIMTRNAFQIQMQRISSIPIPRWFITEKEISKDKEIRIYQIEKWVVADDFGEKKVFFMKNSLNRKLE